ncbi:MAG: hypothetical protein KJ607_13660, partial [Bacteroidetes bacterium]|nr:hypothetical protein [Bacteroidota bacterium]
MHYSSDSQNVAITDDNGYTANPSAMLDVKSTSKGMLVPRLTTVQRNMISDPATGLLVFDTGKGSFYFYTGTEWINLTYGNTSNLWTRQGARVFLNDSTWRVGLGTNMPTGKLEVKGNASAGIDDPIFGVINSDGDTVFAVYPEGVRVFVNDDPVKSTGNRAGFAVGGYSLSKGETNEYLRVTPDSVRIYVGEGSGSKSGINNGGFAVGGFSLSKGALTNEYLRVTDDSIRMYINKDGGSKSSGSTGGFAVGGFSLSKTTPDDYFNISGADSTEVINPSEARMVWYPTKEAFLSGRVLIQSVDSVGTNSMATGFESKAIGDYSQALGFHARAYGSNSTAIGNYADARAGSSYALGDEAVASGLGSYAFGSVDRDTLGITSNMPTTASGNYSFAIGMGAKATEIGAFAIGNNTTAEGKQSTSIGTGNTTTGTYSVAIGSNNTNSGTYAVALGRSSNVAGKDNVSIGWGNEVSSYFQAVAGAIYPQSVAIGTNCTAGYSVSGDPAMMVASGQSVAIGRDCIAKSVRSSSGFPATMYAAAAVAIGREATAEGSDVFAIGTGNSATGDYSMSFGHGIKVEGGHSVGIALNDQSSTTITQDNVLAIMGGRVSIGYTNPSTELHVQGNVYVNSSIGLGTASYGNGTKVLAIEAGTTPSSSVSNAVILYANGINAELKVRDELGNITTLSPHNFSITPKSEPMA